MGTMKVDLYITGQYWENYGDAADPYWKPKGNHEECVAEGLEHGSPEFFAALAKAEAMEIAGNEEFYSWDANGAVVYPAGASDELRLSIDMNWDCDLNESDFAKWQAWKDAFGTGRNRISPKREPLEGEDDAPAMLIPVRHMSHREVLRAGW